MKGLDIQISKAIALSLSQAFRRDWLRLIMLVSSSRSPINIRHLDKATVSTGNDSIVSEGNYAYMWSRYIKCSTKSGRFVIFNNHEGIVMLL